MSDKQKFKAVIFDWDGTLVDSTSVILGAHNHVRDHMGLEPWTLDDIFGCSSKSARETYPEIYGERSDDALSVLYNYTDNFDLSLLSVFESSHQVLKFIYNNNLPMAVVSNKRHDPLQREVTHFGWEEFFPVAIGAGRAERDKPHAAPLLMAINELEVDLHPSEILYVGDTETDLLCAQNAGCQSALVEEYRPRPYLIEKYNPDYVCAKLEDLCEVIMNNRTEQKESVAG